MILNQKLLQELLKLIYMQSLASMADYEYWAVVAERIRRRTSMPEVPCSRPGREFAIPKPFSYGAIFSPQLINQGDLDRE